jgi:alkylation response protein AidB-like acyl-CoA dehydrogenase
MDFELSSEYTAIKDIARDFLAERWSAETMRRALDEPPARIPADLWNELAEMGWLGIACSETAGGSGEGVLAAALLAEAAGRSLLPGALVSAIVSAIAIDRGGDDAIRRELLPAILAGACRPALAFEETGNTWGEQGIGLTAHSTEAGVYSLSGRKILALDATGADLILAAARCGDRIALLAVAADAPGLSMTPMRRIDGQDIAEIVFEDVRVPTSRVLGRESAPGALVREVYQILTVLTAADLLGTAEAVLEMTTAYCKERTQFGRPIGAFQAVSHRLADVLVEVEIGRSLLYAACLALNEQRSDASALVSAAKSWLNEAAVAAAEAAVQLHGGIGYTWELDVHLYLRRARANALTLGDSVYHRETVAQYMDLCYG